MESQEENSNFVKRVVLPSGKTIDVVPPKPHLALHVCLECDSDHVYPVEWEEAGPEDWSVLLHCPNCHCGREGVFDQETVERFDEELDRGADSLLISYKRMVRANMTDELDRFVVALHADAILPEDF